MSDTIMIVDDEHEIADLIEVYLKNENFEVFKFYSPTDALACLSNLKPDLAVLDVMMPEMNGFTLCQKIREKYTFPIIMLTAKEEETDKLTGLTLGADDYITKPFRPIGNWWQGSKHRSDDINAIILSSQKMRKRILCHMREFC